MSSKNICVIGLGFVGLTLSVILAKKGFTVFGIENNPEILKKLKQGQAHFFEKGLDSLIKKFLDKNFFVFDSIPNVKEIDAFVISVGTPLNKETKKPIMAHIISTSQEVADNLKDEQLVVLRSTVPIGTTREIVMPILEKTGKKFYLSFCPERTTEGIALKELEELPQIIGGLNQESIQKARDIFSQVTPTIIEVDTLEDAEMNKMLDNAYRDLTFACANEIALIAKKLGLDGYELIEAGNLGYPRTEIPSPGFVGGACLEKDPWIFIDCINQKTGYLPKLIKAAREINEDLPVQVAQRVKEYLEEKGLDLAKAKVFISGFAFKGRPATDDLRGSTTLNFVDELRKRKIANLYGHDFVVKPAEIKKLDVQSVEIEDGFKEADVVLFMNNHISYEDLDIEKLLLTMKKGGLFFDGWHIYDAKSIKKLNHIIYEGIGV